MILVEGPDGAGKTNLVKRIAKEFDIPIGPRASHSIDGPVQDLTHWVDVDLLSWGHSTLKIYDRYPLISEPIYGTIIRSSLHERFTSSWMRARFNLMRSMSLVIWCLPALETIQKNVLDNSQMYGVEENYQALWMLYSVHANMWTGPSMIYDYTESNRAPRDTQLANLIRRHIISWRHFS